MRIRILVTIAVFAIAPLDALRAGFINFENFPAPINPLTHFEGGLVNSQYFLSLGVTFSLGNGGSPILVERGGPVFGFNGFGAANDVPLTNPSFNALNFFLRDAPHVPGQGLGNPPVIPVIMSFATPMASVSGYILDIDGNEAWMIEAYNASNIMIDSVFLPNIAGDGAATPWSFDRAGADISSIRIVFAGLPNPVNNRVGWALDNISFSAEVVPVPPTVVLLGVAALNLAVVVRFRRRFT